MTSNMQTEAAAEAARADLQHQVDTLRTDLQRVEAYDETMQHAQLRALVGNLSQRVSIATEATGRAERELENMKGRLADLETQRRNTETSMREEISTLKRRLHARSTATGSVERGSLPELPPAASSDPPGLVDANGFDAGGSKGKLKKKVRRLRGKGEKRTDMVKAFLDAANALRIPDPDRRLGKEEISKWEGVVRAEAVGDGAKKLCDYILQKQQPSDGSLECVAPNFVDAVRSTCSEKVGEVGADWSAWFASERNDGPTYGSKVRTATRHMAAEIARILGE